MTSLPPRGDHTWRWESHADTSAAEVMEKREGKGSDGRKFWGRFRRIGGGFEWVG